MRASFAQALFLTVLLVFAITVEGSHAQDLSGVPAKIEVVGQPAFVDDQPAVKVTVELRDPQNKPARASKDVEIELQGRTDRGAIEKSTVTIRKGKTAATAELSIKQAALVEVTATNPQLASGGTLVEIRGSEKRESPRSAPKPASTVESPFPSAGAASAPVRAKPARPAPQLPSAAAVSRTPTSLPKQASTESPEATPQFFSAPAAGPAGPVWKLHYYPVRSLRADETDPATVWASLEGDETAPVDMQVFVMSDLGPLTPEPITIPKGSRIGKSQLIANSPGAVHVWYVYSTPTDGTTPDPPLKINFCSPVWGLRVEPTVPRVVLFDSVEVAVEPIDFHKRTVLTDERRDVYLSLLFGTGELVSSQLTFQPNQGRVVTKFIPAWTGVARFSVRSNNLPDAFGEVAVTSPYRSMALWALGSLLGGLVAYWTEQGATWRRIVIGLVTGFVLYWAFLLGIVHVASFPHAFVVNPFSAVILPFFGGWGGTKVIALVLKRVGFES